MNSLVLIAAALLAAPGQARAAAIRNVWAQPAFLCPGQSVTVHYEASHGLNQDLYAEAVFSTDSSVQLTDYAFVYDSLFTGTGACPAAPLSPIESWRGMAMGPSTPSITTFLPYQAVACVPAFTSGTTVHILLKVKDGYSAFTTGAANADLAIEVNCNKRRVTNQASFWYADSNTVSLDIDNSCGGTPSNTPTFTKTFTPTLTRSPTSTVTVTSSSTLTRSPTSTYTLTATPSASPSSTLTGSPTSTFTASPTPSMTLTATLTRTPSFTATDTITPGPTPTFTLSYTYTSTFSATPTVSPSSTYTPSDSPSPTRTPTPTWTPTVTVTTPYTSTSTPTVTPSYTDSPTATITLTPTASASATLTATETATFTDSPTRTFTRTVTETFTETQTYSPSPTHSQTPVPVPFKLVVGVYNAAGERVRSLYAGGAQALPLKIQTDQNLLVEGKNTVNLETGVRLGNGQTFLGWNGANDTGQMVKGGSYYFKLEFSDPFGKVTTMIQGIEVIDPKGENTLTIYNSAGEVVYEQNLLSLVSTTTDLELKDKVLATSYDPVTGAPLNKLKGVTRDDLGGISPWSWDGRNQHGQPVKTGVYTAKLVSTVQGSQKVVVRSFTVIDGGETLRDPLPHGAPNPVHEADLKLYNGKLRLDYDKLAGYLGSAATLYNLAGEVISVGTDKAGSGTLMLPFGDRASGIYIVRFEALSTSGQWFRKSVKISVIR